MLTWLLSWSLLNFDAKLFTSFHIAGRWLRWLDTEKHSIASIQNQYSDKNHYQNRNTNYLCLIIVTVEIKEEYMKYIVILQVLRVYKDSVLKIYISFTQHCMDLNMLKNFEEYLLLNYPWICMYACSKLSSHNYINQITFFSFINIKIHNT